MPRSSIGAHLDNMKFKTLEEAQEAFNKLESEKKAVDTALKTATDKLGKSETALAKAKEDLTTAKSDLGKAEEVALDAVNKLNEKAEQGPKKVTAKINGDTYEIVFGVDGLTKEELAKDADKLSKMLSKGTAALVKVEGK